MTRGNLRASIPGRRLLLAALACALAAAAVASTVPAQAASSTTVVTLSVPSATNLDSTACPATTPGITSFGTALPGTSTTTTGDCNVLFGSSNDTAMLRLYQRDRGGDAMRPAPSHGTGVVGMWTFDGGLADLADQSSLANAGVLPPVAQRPLEVAGPSGYGGALDFDGANDLITMPYLPAYDLTSFTVDAWVRTAATEVEGYVAMRGTTACGSPGLCSWAIWADAGGNLEIDIERGGVELVLATGVDITTNTWKHVAFSIDATNTVRAYVDGVQAGSPLVLPGPIDVGNGPITVGADPLLDPGARLDGSVDELRIVAGAAAPSTIRAWAQARIRDYVNGTTDWDTAGTSLFGACLDSVTDGASTDGTTWTPSAGCAASDGAWWNDVVPTPGTAGSVVARTGPNDTNARAHLRFGFRTPDTQLPATYEAPLAFEVVAPAT